MDESHSGSSHTSLVKATHFWPAIAAHAFSMGVAILAWRTTWISTEVSRFVWITLSIGQATVVCSLTAQWFVALRTMRSLCSAITAYLITFACLAGYVMRYLGFPFSFDLIFIFFLVMLPSLNASIGARILLHYLGYEFVSVGTDNVSTDSLSSSVPLRRFFATTAGLAALIGLVRATPAHLHDATAIVAVASAVALSIIGIVAIFAVPGWVVFSEHRRGFRWALLGGTIMTFSTLVPLGYQLSWQWWAGFLFVISYLVGLQYFSLLPFRLAGFRLRRAHPAICPPSNSTTFLPTT